MAEWSAGWIRNLAVPAGVGIPLRPLAGFVLGRAEFSSSAIQLINSQLVASSVPVGLFNPVTSYLNYVFLSI